MSAELAAAPERRPFFSAYKPGQARTSRSVIFWIGLGLIAWGCRALMLALPAFFSVLGRSLNEFDAFGGALPRDGWSVDLVFFTAKVSPAFLISIVLLLVACLWWWRFVNTPKWADLFIEMEHELRKVSWPTFGDAWQSTLVVTLFTIALVAIMFVADMMIRSILEMLTQLVGG